MRIKDLAMDGTKLIEEAERLSEHATPGPWTASCAGIRAHDGAHTVVYAIDGYEVESADADFIARSRMLVTELAAALRDTTAREQATIASLRCVEASLKEYAAANVAANAEIVRLHGLLDEARRFAKENAEHALDIAKERDAARAELAEECQLTDDASRLVVLCLDALGEDVARLADDPYDAKSLNALRRGIPERIKELRAELVRLTTPRPIAEAPMDGTWLLVYWDETVRKDIGRFSRYLIAQWRDGEWRDEDGDDLNPPTHFLPLPTEGGQR